MSLRLAIALAFSLSLSASAAPLVVSHHGRLLGADDAPVTGRLALTFRILDAPTAGTPLWTGTCDVDVSRGYYAVLLGDACGSGLDDAIFANAAARYLEFAIGDATLSPRQILATLPRAAVAFTALDATHLGGRAAETFAPVDAPTFTGAVTLPGDPSAPLEAATKQYVDGQARLTTLNGLSAPAQDFAVTAAGTAPAFRSTGTTHTLELPLASTNGTTAGLVSNAEWTSLNGKLSGLSGDVTTSGSTATVAKINGAPLGTTTGAATGSVLAWNGAAWAPGAAGGPSFDPFGQFLDFIGWSSLDGFAPGQSSGSPNILATGAVLLMKTGSAAGDDAWVTTTGYLKYGFFSGGGKRNALEFFWTGDDSNQTRTVYLIASYNTSPHPIELNAAHLGFKIVNKAIFGTNGNASGNIQTNLNTTISNNTRLRAEYDSVNGCRFYVNGVLKGTVATKLPEQNDVGLIVKVTNDSNADYTRFRLGRIVVLQEY